MATYVPTPLEDIPKIRERARAAFKSKKTKSIAFRKEQIAQLGYMLKDNEDRFFEALKQDLGRPELESKFFDLGGMIVDIRDAYDKVERWAAPQKADCDITYWAMKPETKAEPKGTVLIMAPHNFPVFLTLGPLIGAIAGGNAAVVKPSHLTPTVAALIAELFPHYLDNDLYHIVNGGIPEATKLLELQWDHIFYTGNGKVGRIIAEAAAKHITPVTLELGGKNPVVIDPKTDLKLAAKRISWGRFSNAGQVCLCPEYVLVPETFQNTLIEALKETYNTFYPDGPENSDSFSRVVSKESAERIKRLLDRTKGTIVLGGKIDSDKRYVAPTIVSNVPVDDSLMEEEIFGPVLLLVPVKDEDEALEIINARDQPLTVYVFSHDKKFQSHIADNTQSGSVIYNECLILAGIPGLPLGGVGPSGHGYNTGKDMFDEFTYKRAMLDNPSWVDMLGFGCRYPPYKSIKSVERVLPSLPPRPGQKSGMLGRWAMLFGTLAVGVAFAGLTPSTRLSGLLG